MTTKERFDEACPKWLLMGQAEGCVLCGQPIEWGSGPMQELEYQERGVCRHCAEGIANLYHHAWMGSYLTWNAKPGGGPSGPLPVPEEMRWRVFKRDGFACRVCGDTAVPLRAVKLVPGKDGTDCSMNEIETRCLRHVRNKRR